jgi:glycosyltransferase involved in cell wall biosynthesis
MSVRESIPMVSVGLAVRNERRCVRRCIESVLGQDLADLELVICDNVSDDGTTDILHEYARADARVRLTVNPVNIGSQENMNSVLLGSRGTLFRWISADDWLEPHALAAGADALQRHPEAIGVTCGFTLHSPDTAPRHEDYRGEFPSSPDAARRFERMLWFFHAGEAKYDPIYGIYRRQHLMRSRRLRPSERADWLLCAELALLGPIIHNPQRLANRSWRLPTASQRTAFRRRLDPTHGERLKTTPTRLYHELNELTHTATLTTPQHRRCKRALRRTWARDLIRFNRLRLADAIHQARPT